MVGWGQEILTQRRRDAEVGSHKVHKEHKDWFLERARRPETGRPTEGLQRRPRESGRERQLLDAADVGGVELRERETLASKVFQRCADKIKFLVVDDKKAVVERFVVADGEFRVLRVEGLDIGRGNQVFRNALLEML